MTAIELSPRLLNPLQLLARQQEASVEEIVEVTDQPEQEFKRLSRRLAPSRLE